VQREGEKSRSHNKLNSGSELNLTEFERKKWFVNYNLNAEIGASRITTRARHTYMSAIRVSTSLSLSIHHKTREQNTEIDDSIGRCDGAAAAAWKCATTEQIIIACLIISCFVISLWFASERRSACEGDYLRWFMRVFPTDLTVKRCSLLFSFNYFLFAIHTLIISLSLVSSLDKIDDALISRK
jgi:hypothetical protein